MMPPQPIRGAGDVERLGVAFGDHNMAVHAHQRHRRIGIVISLPGGAIGVGERLDAGIGNQRHHIAVEARGVGGARRLDRREP